MIDPTVVAELWKRNEAQARAHVHMFVVNPGMKADRAAGKTAKEVTFDAVMELVQLVYVAGLNQGYDMARAVFAPDNGDA